MKNKLKPLLSIIILLFLVSAGAFLYSREAGKDVSIRIQGFKLDTVITITVYGTNDESILDECMDICDYYEGLFSRTLPSSELYRLNHGEISEVSEETASLIRTGLMYSELSGGAFDISIAPVSSLWDFTSEENTIPSAEDLERALALVDYRLVSLNGTRVSFEKEGMALDLGAIAKGYIADRIKEYLVEQGIEKAVINLGGNVLCLGNRPDNIPFQIGIQKPFAGRSEFLMTCGITDCSLVTSGTYERYFEKDGKFYHHLLNPATGYPYDNGLCAVTIQSEHSVDGDALSTICFALGPEKGMELLNSLPDVEGFFVSEGDLAIQYSAGFPR